MRLSLCQLLCLLLHGEDVLFRLSHRLYPFISILNPIWRRIHHLIGNTLNSSVNRINSFGLCRFNNQGEFFRIQWKTGLLMCRLMHYSFLFYTDQANRIQQLIRCNFILYIRRDSITHSGQICGLSRQYIL